MVGRRLLTDADRTGLIMELPPYHKPRWGALIRVSLNKMWQTFKRAVRVVTVAMVILWALSYTKSGNIDGSIIYRFGTAIEPVTLVFGLRWETFIAWLASMFGKEGALGVMAAIFSNTGVLTAISHSSIQSAAERRANAHAAARIAMDACNLRRNHIESNPDTKVESVNKESLPEWGQFF